MRSYLVDQAALIPVLFSELGEPFIPDADSVTWTLRSQSGAVVSGFVDVSVTTGPTDVQVNITIPALQNTISSGLLFEKRTIMVSALRGGKPWMHRVSYYVVPWSNHIVDAAYARSLVGLDDSDVPDSDLDIFNAYLVMSQRLGQTEMEDALSSGTEQEMLVNRAIAARALLDAMPAISNRILKRRTDGSIQAERFKFDRELMEAALRGHIDQAVLSVFGETGESTLLFSFGAPTDPITG